MKMYTEVKPLTESLEDKVLELINSIPPNSKAKVNYKAVGAKYPVLYWKVSELKKREKISKDVRVIKEGEETWIGKPE